MRFVYYDTETTGTDTAFDQILQFGAILTDGEFNELDRFEIRCRVLPYVVAAPGAMRVTGVTVEQLTDPALPSHYEMVRAIRAKLTEWSPATFIGHNSIGFDEPLLRQALYKTLHAPYLTNTNGNCRTDSLRMIQAVALLKPGVLTIPQNDRGRLSFKLDQLAPANGFAHEHAHEAMADVEATIHLCRLIKDRAPDLWGNFSRFAQKPAVMDYVLSEDVFALTEFYYTRPCSWLVTAIDLNPDNGAEVLVFDLSHDPGDLARLSDQELVSKLTERPRAVRGLRTNAAPIVTSYGGAPAQFREEAPDLVTLSARAAFIKDNQEFRGRLVKAYLEGREDFEPSPHVEQQIYDGFIGNADQALLDRFHEAEWDERTSMLTGLFDDRLRSLGRRLVYTEAPELMSDQARSAYDVAIAERLMAEKGSVPWLTLPEALDQADDLIAGATAGETQLLKGHRDYLASQIKWATSLLTD